MNVQPISTRRAGAGCLAALVTAGAPFAIVFWLSDAGTAARWGGAFVAFTICLLLGPFIIGWALGIDIINGDIDTVQVVSQPGPHDPVHRIDHADRDARHCRNPRLHEPHPYFWSAELPYTEMLPDGSEVHSTHTIRGGTWCEGRQR